MWGVVVPPLVRNNRRKVFRRCSGKRSPFSALLTSILPEHKILGISKTRLYSSARSTSTCCSVDEAQTPEIPRVPSQTENDSRIILGESLLQRSYGNLIVKTGELPFTPLPCINICSSPQHHIDSTQRRIIPFGSLDNKI